MEDIEDAIEAIGLSGSAIVEAGWTPGLSHFEIDLADGRTIRFVDCVQVAWQCRVGPDEPQTIGGWWLDEPSPVLDALPPEVAFQYRHLVMEVGESLLRVAFRGLAVGESDAAC